MFLIIYLCHYTVVLKEMFIILEAFKELVTLERIEKGKPNEGDLSWYHTLRTGLPGQGLQKVLEGEKPKKPVNPN